MHNFIGVQPIYIDGLYFCQVSFALFRVGASVELSDELSVK